MNVSSFQLSLEQDFQIRLIERSMQDMSKEQLQDMLLQIARLLLVKENIIRDLVKSCVLGSTVGD
jgi:Phycobilisome degradation protein nblA